MYNLLTRRRFFQALAASALVAAVPLPIGFPTAPLRPPVDGYFVGRLVIFISDNPTRHQVGEARQIVGHVGARIHLNTGASLRIGHSASHSSDYAIDEGRGRHVSDTFIIV